MRHGPRAVWRLESPGFKQVYNYHPGKHDWVAAGLPAEGKLAELATVGELVREGLPTCDLADRVGDIQARVEASGWNVCVVVNPHRIVLGILRRRALQGDPQATGEQVMEPGPSTYRPNVPAGQLVEQRRKADLHTALVTTSEGEPIGMAFREDMEATLAHEAAHEHEPA